MLAYLQTQVEALKSLDPMVRGDEPDAVHQMRVATRRLRSTLCSFGHIIGDGTQELIAELKWLGTMLGQARDGERLRAQARQTWKRASRPRYRRWMH